MSPTVKQADRPVEFLSAYEKPVVAVSVIIPVAERCDDLAEIYHTHAVVLNGIGCSFEFVFVIDKGFAEAARKLEPLVARGEPIRVVVLPSDGGFSSTSYRTIFAGRSTLTVMSPAASGTRSIPESCPLVKASECNRFIRAAGSLRSLRLIFG